MLKFGYGYLTERSIHLNLGVDTQQLRVHTQTYNSKLKSSVIFSVPLYFKVILNLIKTSVVQWIRHAVHTRQARVRFQPSELFFH